MKKEKMETIGKALFAVGIAIVAIGLIFPQAVAQGMTRIIIDTTPPSLDSGWPNGTESEPNSVMIGKTYTVSTGVISVFTHTSGKGDPTIERVWAEIDLGGDGTVDKELTLAWDGVVRSEYDLYVAEWVVPTIEKAKFVFKAVDIAGHTGEIGPFWVSVAPPSGNFYIMDEDDAEWSGPLDENITLVFNRNTLHFKFETATPELIDAVEIEVEGGRTAMDKVSASTWTTSMTFEDGTYDVHGVIKSGTREFTAMSLIIGIPTEPGLPFPSETMLVIGTGLVLAAFGGVLWKKGGE